MQKEIEYKKFDYFAKYRLLKIYLNVFRKIDELNIALDDVRSDFRNQKYLNESLNNQLLSKKR